MNHSIRKTALAAAVALPAALGVQTASAALITHWNYQIDSAFTNFTETTGTGSGVVGSDINTDAFGGTSPTTLSWGVPSNPDDAQSSISVQSDVDSTPATLLETDTAGVPGATFTHDNNVIEAGSSILDTFQLSTQLVLTQATPPGPGEETVGPLTFNGFFTETRNLDTAEDCFDGSDSACDDIFVLGNAGTIGAPDGDGNFVFPDSFIVEDYRYDVFLTISGLGELTETQCRLADAGSGCIGFLTEENMENNFSSTVRITATEIPAPGVLALLGVGLLGLGFTHRARRS